MSNFLGSLHFHAGAVILLYNNAGLASYPAQNADIFYAEASKDALNITGWQNKQDNLCKEQGK